MKSSDVFADGFSRLRDTVHRSVRQVGAEDLARRPYPDGNSIGWLIWHLTRVQDDHVAEAAGLLQVWTAQGFTLKLALPFDESATGYGHSTAEVGAVRVASAGLLLEYHDAVCEQTLAFLRPLGDDDFDRVVDESWDPPVTLGVRLVSVLMDSLQHAGQAAYLRGMFRAR